MKRQYRIILMIAALFVLGISGTAVADIQIWRADLTGGTGASGTALLDIAIGSSPADPEGVPLHVEFTGLSSELTAITLDYPPYVESFPLNNPLDDHSDPTQFGLLGVAYFSEALYGGYLTLTVHSADYPDGEIDGVFYLFETVGTESSSWGAVKALFR